MAMNDSVVYPIYEVLFVVHISEQTATKLWVRENQSVRYFTLQYVCTRAEHRPPRPPANRGRGGGTCLVVSKFSRKNGYCNRRRKCGLLLLLEVNTGGKQETWLNLSICRPNPNMYIKHTRACIQVEWQCCWVTLRSLLLDSTGDQSFRCNGFRRFTYCRWCEMLVGAGGWSQNMIKWGLRCEGHGCMG